MIFYKESLQIFLTIRFEMNKLVTQSRNSCRPYVLYSFRSIFGWLRNTSIKLAPNHFDLPKALLRRGSCIQPMHVYDVSKLGHLRPLRAHTWLMCHCLEIVFIQYFLKRDQVIFLAATSVDYTSMKGYSFEYHVLK